jgi:hypothetical protein
MLRRHGVVHHPDHVRAARLEEPSHTQRSDREKDDVEDSSVIETDCSVSHEKQAREDAGEARRPLHHIDNMLT